MAAANRTLAPGTDNAAKNLRITKEEYRAFLMRDADVEICRARRVLVGDVFAPVDRLFAAADTDNDGRLDASEIRRSNLTDAATVWILAGDTDGDGMLSAQELANGLPQFRDLQPRSGMQRALPEHLRRIRETAGLAAVASYDVDKDGRLALEEMRVHSSDFTRRSMGQTMVPVWYEDFLGFFFFGFSSSFFSSFRSCPRPLVFFPALVLSPRCLLLLHLLFREKTCSPSFSCPLLATTRTTTKTKKLPLSQTGPCRGTSRSFPSTSPGGRPRPSGRSGRPRG
jgi:hypothetical protein